MKPRPCVFYKKRYIPPSIPCLDPKQKSPRKCFIGNFLKKLFLHAEEMAGRTAVFSNGINPNAG